MQAITAKNQKTVNKCVKAHERYNELNDMRNAAEDNDNMKLYAKLDKQCANAFDKYLEFLYELPKNQQQAIEKHFFNF
jgi:RNA binding exosome subunit